MNDPRNGPPSSVYLGRASVTRRRKPHAAGRYTSVLCMWALCYTTLHFVFIARLLRPQVPEMGIVVSGLLMGIGFPIAAVLWMGVLWLRKRYRTD